MSRPREGYAQERKQPGKKKSKWYARWSWTDENGERKYKQKAAKNEADANKILRTELHNLDSNGTESMDHAEASFEQFAEWFGKQYLIPAIYRDGIKTDGLRSLETPKKSLKTLVSFFGAMKLRSIKTSDIERYRTARLDAPIAFKNKKGEITGERKRSIASVNRELALLRRMLRVAQNDRWILKNPFSAASKPLINAAGEKQRQRILTPEEETRLLAACDTPNRQHLKPILIAALDTGMRQGEIFQLTWDDVDLDKRLINIRGTYTKTLQARTVTMRQRLLEAVQALQKVSSGNGSDRVFGVVAGVERSFAGAKKDAGIVDNVRFHDLRHTAASKMVRGGLPLPFVGRVLGHTQLQTTMRYVNADETTGQSMVDALDRAEVM